MNKIDYEHRKSVYNAALLQYGANKQLFVAIEEMSEVQKEICKMLRGKGDIEHLAEEIADATIMFEQIRLFWDLNDKVCEYMDSKVKRLWERIDAE